MEWECFYIGPPVDDWDILRELPDNLHALLQQINGCTLFRGGLHLRGACQEPAWHSLREAWRGEHALHKLFPALQESDVPFAQDCLGDQFVLRGGLVSKLSAEDGQVEGLNLSLGEFLEAAHRDPLNFLSLFPLEKFRRGGNELEPGQLLSVYPPFISKESTQGISLKAIPAHERLRFLADLARQVSALAEGEKLQLKLTE
jgi:hypothetical protein